MRRVKFSVVIPSFNDVRILDTIDSINNQSIDRNFTEIVIMDGGSEPELLLEIKQNLSSQDNLISEPDQGIFDGINRGILASKGEVIYTLGSDDKLAYPDAIEDILDFFEDQNIDYLSSDLIYTDQDWNPERYWSATKPSFFSFLIGRQIGHFSFAARRRLYSELGMFNIALSVSADFDFFLRLGKSSMRGEKFNKVTTFMKLGGNSSKNLKNILLGNLQMLRVAFMYYGPLCIVHFALKPFWKFREYKNAKYVS